MAHSWTFCVSGRDVVSAISSVTRFCRDLMQTLGCINDHRSNPQLKRRCEQDIIDPPISQWEQAGFAGPLRRRIAGENLELHAPMQLPHDLPTNSWDVDNFLTSNQCSHQRPLMTSQVDNTLYHPITAQNTDSVLFPAGTNSHPSMYTQPDLLVPMLQPHSSTDDPHSMGLNLSDDLLAVWSNPSTFRCVLLSHIMTSSDALLLAPATGMFSCQMQRNLS
jgi:hypothetical protein